MKNPKNILIVEDNVSLYNAMTRSIRAINRQSSIKWVDNAEEAIRTIFLENFQLVIVDNTLIGKMTGLDVWRVCRQHYPELPFLMISGLSIKEFFESTEGQPPLRFLPKPFTVAELTEAVEEYL